MMLVGQQQTCGLASSDWQIGRRIMRRPRVGRTKLSTKCGNGEVDDEELVDKATGGSCSGTV